MRTIRVALAQINPIVGDFEGNVKKIISAVESAEKLAPDIIAFPELVVCGYPPEDLLLNLDFVQEAGDAVDEIARATAHSNSIIIVGFPEMEDDLYNAAAIIFRGRVWDTYRKIFLPNYGVFDEKRYFAAGNTPKIYDTPAFRFGMSICEDIWHPEGPVSAEALMGNADLVININSSPYDYTKRHLRERMVSTRARDAVIPIAYVNLVGGQDELVFDGSSFVVNQNGEIVARADSFAEDIIFADLALDDVLRRRLHDPRRRDLSEHTPLASTNVEVVEIPYLPRESRPPIESKIAPPMEKCEEIWNALVLGLRDYVRKNGFRSVILGLSGGIDSSLVAAIAADAVGPENVHAVFMPTRFTRAESYDGAKKLAENLGINLKIIEIEPLFEEYLKNLAPHFEGKPFDITEENIQSRIRGNILMALSNKFGHLVLAAGNKSEMSVGYATLYGDMVGGFAVIKDVPKTLVWELARWKNKSVGREVIPEFVIERPPSAELRENQLDTDTLPPYDILDRILDFYIEQEMSPEEIAERTDIDPEIIRRVARMVDRAEYKRRQAPPGIKITTRAFGKERRMPITRK